MKNSKLSFIIIVILLFFLLQSVEAIAQCQACKSTVESNLADGGTIGLGLNNGILYLLAMPYLMVASVGAIWFFKFRNKKQTI